MQKYVNEFRNVWMICAHVFFLYSVFLLICVLTLIINGRMEAEQDGQIEASTDHAPPRSSKLNNYPHEKHLNKNQKSGEWSRYLVLTSYRWKRHWRGYNRQSWIADAPSPPSSEQRLHGMEKKICVLGGERAQWLWGFALEFSAAQSQQKATQDRT